ncbi:MAG: alpha-glucan family phosphorylase [Anaerolineales bacterium]|nr:alpha-glucan family phosphorylase [Anaerolineales bacterium]
MKPVATVSVAPNLPPSLERLLELAYNLHWSWDVEARLLFQRLDRDLWEETVHNPVLLLGRVSQAKLQEAAEDEAFLAHLDRVCAAFDRYMNEKSTWYTKNVGAPPEKPEIAYFSMEFGLTECLRNYSGGLGILSGDHLKSASDLGLPLVGVGLLYQEGYFAQYLNADGYQQEEYPINDYANQPVSRVLGEDKRPLLVKVALPGRMLHAQIWRVKVGRVPLYLLDTNIPENTLQEDRNLTDRLYGGDRRQRIRQEILMGIGGIQALSLMGYKPIVYHMNEGHSTFMGLERIRLLMKENPGLNFIQAKDICAAGNVFTTHTPVPAGLERFGFDLIDEHFGAMWSELGLTREQFHDLGRESMGGYDLFAMPVLALKLSSVANGVARLHGEVSRYLWRWIYPNLPQDDVPISHVTNGIHVETWLSREMMQLYDRYLGPEWRTDPTNKNVWKDVEKIPDAELWRTHERRRERSIAFCRERLRKQLQKRGASPSEIAYADEVLNPEALTIGFARRFATYKRATMIFRDRERLARLLNNSERPVQLIFAGKAHPHDTPGKELIREIVNLSRLPEFRNSIVFLENYDMAVARMMLQGIDVWLNNPRRPEEASGTSGMKAIYNGGLNLSTLDGWWDEGYSAEVGWEIGRGEEYPESAYALQDMVESQALLTILETDVVPLFYERTRDGLPREWIAKMKNSIRDLAPFFNTYRMVREYTEKFYMPAKERYLRLTSPDLKRGIAYSQWLTQTYALWEQVKVLHVTTNANDLKIGDLQEVKALVDLGRLTPKDVRVQAYHGTLDTQGLLLSGTAKDMTATNARNGDGSPVYEFVTEIAYDSTGQQGLSVRILPNHEDLPTPFLQNLIRWA